MLDAFYNGFPIVYSDTSTYIASGLEFETPFDRPITYGLFIALFSLHGSSLWLVVFAQAIILAYLIFLLVSLVTGKKTFLKWGLLCIIFLSVCTSVSWTVCQLMPDIFTPIALLCIALILSGKFKQGTLIVLYLLFFLSVAMHISHLVLFALILLTLFLLRKFILPTLQYPKAKQLMIPLALFIPASILTMGSALSKSKHVFFMGALVEHGIAKSYLDDNCPTKPYKLCAYKDSLPAEAYQFIWDEKSPFYKIGGWKETKAEFNEIIYGTLTKPKYIAMHLKASAKATLQQLGRFAIGDGNGSFAAGTVLYGRIQKYFPHDLSYYAASRQNRSQLNEMPFFNNLFFIVCIASLLAFIFMLVKFSGEISGDFKLIAVLFFIGILLNAWDCATFANAINRLGCKMIWLIPFIAILFIFKIQATKRLATEAGINTNK